MYGGVPSIPSIPRVSTDILNVYIDWATVEVGTTSGRRNSNGYFQVAMGLVTWKNDGERGIVGV